MGGDVPADATATTPGARGEWIVGGKCQFCWAENRGEGCDWAMCGCSCHDDDDGPWDDDEVSDGGR